MRLKMLVFFAGCAIAGYAQAVEECGELANAYGPYDYRTDKQKLAIVEQYHFQRGVETLMDGRGRYLAADIDYTLRAFPNHHRALVSMEKLATRMKRPQVPGARYSVSCYFHRAIRFRPDDGTVRMLYANYLAKHGKPNEALQQMQAAEKLLGENANLHYNMGLVYVNLKDYDKALEHAHRAYALGFPLPGLRNMLERAGKWREPRISQAVKAEPAGAAASSPAPTQDAAPVGKAE